MTENKAHSRSVKPHDPSRRIGHPLMPMTGPLKSHVKAGEEMAGRGSGMAPREKDSPSHR